MAKTFIPRLLYLMRVLCLYIVRYRRQLEEYLPVGAAPYLDEIMEACEALTALVDVPVGP